ncbi:PIN domain-containing protein [Protaetiibacter sp. WY-16]|uniref:PIN domain-containing protein n=1 Tax=Antiquaquibacter soli TaxID=3064523 RepID=A0ABT9BQE5_9MICO|nr:PIN domain-containing protein [Protaetiibacter sp. WY-16]
MILLDTSVLLAPPSHWPGAILGSSTICLAELQFGVQKAPTAAIRAQRTRAVATYRSIFEWIPFEEPDAENYGVLAARVAPRRPAHARTKDILIAAQALTLGVPLLTRNVRDFDLVSDLVEILDGNV